MFLTIFNTSRTKSFAFRTGQYPSQEASLQRFFKKHDKQTVKGNCCPPGDLLLNGLRVGLAKQVEQQAGEVVGVRVGIPQLQGVPRTVILKTLRIKKYHHPVSRGDLLIDLKLGKNSDVLKRQIRR